MPPLDGASVLSGATMAPTGGTAINFSSAGIRSNVVTLNCDEDTDYRTRRQVVCTAKEPKPSSTAPNGYTQARSKTVLKSPLELDNGEITVNTVTIEFAFDVETSAAEVDELQVLAAQLITDADFDELWNTGNLS